MFIYFDRRDRAHWFYLTTALAALVTALVTNICLRMVWVQAALATGLVAITAYVATAVIHPGSSDRLRGSLLSRLPYVGLAGTLGILLSMLVMYADSLLTYLYASYGHRLTFAAVLVVVMLLSYLLRRALDWHFLRYQRRNPAPPIEPVDTIHTS